MKLSLFIKDKAAKAISATLNNLIPVMAAEKCLFCRTFAMKREISVINRKEGMHNETVATTEPAMDMKGE